ncbi:hypothetical protein MRX96_053681 [Rhipicephalus microplus]
MDSSQLYSGDEHGRGRNGALRIQTYRSRPRCIRNNLNASIREQFHDVVQCLVLTRKRAGPNVIHPYTISRNSAEDVILGQALPKRGISNSTNHHKCIGSGPVWRQSPARRQGLQGPLSNASQYPAGDAGSDAERRNNTTPRDRTETREVSHVDPAIAPPNNETGHKRRTAAATAVAAETAAGAAPDQSHDPVVVKAVETTAGRRRIGPPRASRAGSKPTTSSRCQTSSSSRASSKPRNESTEHRGSAEKRWAGSTGLPSREPVKPNLHPSNVLTHKRIRKGTLAK